MRASAAALALLLIPGLAWAQNGQSVIVIPPAPPVVAAPSGPAPAPAPQAPAAPAPPQTLPAVPPVSSQTLPSVPPGQAAQPAQSNPQPAQPAQPAPPDVAPPLPNDWVPGQTATLGVLNEVDGSTSQISATVGAQPVKVGDLLVSVQACANRPPNELPDTAVFLTVQSADAGATAPLFRGWMLRSAPGAAIVGDAAESFRVMGCS